MKKTSIALILASTLGMAGLANATNSATLDDHNLTMVDKDSTALVVPVGEAHAHGLVEMGSTPISSYTYVTPNTAVLGAGPAVIYSDTLIMPAMPMGSDNPTSFQNESTDFNKHLLGE
ncbi:hypothetical protein [Ramlibacter sp.]|uniref:hypothetical protein n=1 Tax=Ramlibacter sp. TaxID=1917967 RepID=UPI003D127284